MKVFSVNGPALSRSFAAAGWLAALGLIGGLGLLGGCGAGNPYPTGTYERAQFYVEQEKNLEAVAALESFVRHNPTDSLAPQAQFQKAMVYMTLQEYPLAAVEFQILRKDYPTCDQLEDAYFQEGVAYFRQVDRVERDISGAREARLHFFKFSEEYPSSVHAAELGDYMKQISDLMVLKRLQQAKVFWQLKRYEAIKVTLGTILEEEAGSSLLDEVLWQRGRVAKKLEDPDLAIAMYEKLLADYPDSRFLDRARTALKTLTEEPEPPQEEEQ